jgi:hypothetical protein
MVHNAKTVLVLISARYMEQKIRFIIFFKLIINLNDIFDWHEDPNIAQNIIAERFFRDILRSKYNKKRCDNIKAWQKLRKTHLSCGYTGA